MTGFYGSQELIVQTNPKTDSTAHIEIDNPFLQKYSDFRLPDFSIPSKNSPTLLDQVYMNRFNMYMMAPGSIILFWQSWILIFYVEPDEKYLLDDYTRFQTMEEVFREYVHSLIAYRRKDSFQLYLFDRPANKLFADEPMILIDGVPFFYATELIRQDPMKIRRIDLVTGNTPWDIKYFTALSI
jgi:hypothetical protein